MLFGAHESNAGGCFNAIYRGQQATCDVIQMFNKSNSQWRAKPLTEDELEKFFAAQKETGVTVACSHAAYLINLASPDPRLNVISRESFRVEMLRCNQLRIPNLVVHPGSHKEASEEDGMEKVAANCNRILSDLKDNTVTICLECTAGQGSNLGYTFEQIAYMIDKVEDKAHMGVCIDSCHLFAAGYELTAPKGYKQTMKAFGDTVGFDKLKVMHLNDSKRERGSRVDRHEQIGKGQIGIEGFRNIVNDRRLKKVPMIIETDKDEKTLKEDIANLQLLRSLVKK